MPESSPIVRVSAAFSEEHKAPSRQRYGHMLCLPLKNVSSVLPLVTGLRSTYTLELLAKYSACINSKMIRRCEVCTYGHLIRQKHLHFFIQKNHTFAFHKDLEKKKKFFLYHPSSWHPSFQIPILNLTTTEEIAFPILKGGRFVPVLTSHTNLN